MSVKNGIELIAEERRRQIEKEGFDSEHDEQHEGSELALAAICYAAPEPIYILEVVNPDYAFIFVDPWPEDWDPEWDKRLRTPGGRLCPNIKLSLKKRIRNLVKSGALIAAEIDRLQAPPIDENKEG